MKKLRLREYWWPIQGHLKHVQYGRELEPASPRLQNLPSKWQAHLSKEEKSEGLGALIWHNLQLRNHLKPPHAILSS